MSVSLTISGPLINNPGVAANSATGFSSLNIYGGHTAIRAVFLCLQKGKSCYGRAVRETLGSAGYRSAGLLTRMVPSTLLAGGWRKLKPQLRTIAMADPATNPPAGNSPPDYQDTLKTIDALSQEGFSEIKAIARLAMLRLESGLNRPCDYEDLYKSLSSIRNKAETIEACISAEAERVGCHHIDKRGFQLLNNFFRGHNHVG